MANLSINVQVGATPPSSSTINGTGLTVSAWKASLFLRNPARSQGPPAGSADSTQTTDGSGNATFTGLSAVAYWIEVIDARGVTNWFPCPAARIGGADVFVCTIPWSTPTSVTSPADDRGGDTIGTRTNQGLFAPRTHVHQIPAPGGGDFTNLGVRSGAGPYDFSSLPSWSNFKLVGSLRSASGGGFNVADVVINGDTSSSYNTLFTKNDGSTITSVQEFALGGIPLISAGAAATADVYTSFELDFINAQSAAAFPNALGKQTLMDVPNSVFWVLEIGAIYTQLTAIHEIGLTPSGALTAGSWVELFGYGHT